MSGSRSSSRDGGKQAAGRRRELGALLGRDPVVRAPARQVLGVGPEAQPAAGVEDDVHAEAFARGNGIDEVRDGLREAGRRGEVAALAPVEPVARGVHVDSGERGDRVRVEARRVDDPLGRDALEPAGLPGGDPVAPRRGLEADDLRAGQEHGARVEGLAQEVVHEPVGVHDAGLGRPERADRGDGRLERVRLRRGEARQRDAVAERGRGDRVEDRQFLGPRGRDELAGLRVGNRVAKAQVVDALPALDAEPRLEAARGIVDAGMDDLAVAARSLHAVLRVSVEDDEVRARARQAGRDGEADHAGPDDDDFGIRHRSILRQR